MTTPLTNYNDIPIPVIDMITKVIEQDEGGFKFNDEANGDWNYAGMISEHFFPVLESQGYKFDSNLDYPETSLQQLRKHFEAVEEEELNQLVVLLYYNNFFLPLSNYSNNPVQDFELSCTINCGLRTVKTIYSNFPNVYVTHEGLKLFCDAWEDHYIKLVVDNAVAWQCWAIACENKLDDGLPHGADKPNQLRAANLQGWINRVRRYR